MDRFQDIQDERSIIEAYLGRRHLLVTGKQKNTRYSCDRGSVEPGSLSKEQVILSSPRVVPVISRTSSARLGDH